MLNISHAMAILSPVMSRASNEEKDFDEEDQLDNDANHRRTLQLAKYRTSTIRGGELSRFISIENHRRSKRRSIKSRRQKKNEKKKKLFH